jgi:acyl-CoA thioesterase II
MEIVTLDKAPKSEMSILVTLNHSIHFHNLRALRADQWVLNEVRSSSASGGRAIIHSKLWTADGAFVASCTQEVSLILERQRV